LKIIKMHHIKSVDDVFKDALYQHETPVKSELWERMSERLGSPQEPKRKRRGGVWWAIAALCALTAGSIWWSYLPETAQKESVEFVQRQQNTNTSSATLDVEPTEPNLSQAEVVATEDVDVAEEVALASTKQASSVSSIRKTRSVAEEAPIETKIEQVETSMSLKTTTEEVLLEEAMVETETINTEELQEEPVAELSSENVAVPDFDHQHTHGSFCEMHMFEVKEEAEVVPQVQIEIHLGRAPEAENADEQEHRDKFSRIMRQMFNIKNGRKVNLDDLGINRN
jgi:hypothetical protein